MIYLLHMKKAILLALTGLFLIPATAQTPLRTYIDDPVKKALQIGGVQSTASSWRHPGTSSEAGAQIDLLLDRADQCINICEIKFSTQPFVIDKKYSRELEQKLAAFRQNSGSRKTLFLTFITTYGLSDTIYKEQLADADITMDALFG
jgi:hypothetical protein